VHRGLWTSTVAICVANVTMPFGSTILDKCTDRQRCRTVCSDSDVLCMYSEKVLSKRRASLIWQAVYFFFCCCCCSTVPALLQLHKIDALSTLSLQQCRYSTQATVDSCLSLQQLLATTEVLDLLEGMHMQPPAMTHMHSHSMHTALLPCSQQRRHRPIDSKPPAPSVVVALGIPWQHQIPMQVLLLLFRGGHR